MRERERETETERERERERDGGGRYGERERDTEGERVRDGGRERETIDNEPPEGKRTLGAGLSIPSPSPLLNRKISPVV